MNLSFKKLLFLFTSAAFLGGCSLFDTEQPEPMYLDMDEARLITNPMQGENTHNISDVSVYADGFSIGLYPLPVEVPVLGQSETVEIFAFGVVRNNGIASNPIEYPFYAPIQRDIPFDAFEVKDFDLEFSYDPRTEITQIGDFEVANIFTVDFDSNPNISFTRSPETPYGNFCGKITITEANPFFEKTTLETIDRADVFGSSIFLEMDYKTEVPFAVGIVRIEQGGVVVPFYKVVLTEQEEWNKVYIQLNEELNDNQIVRFTILIGSSQSDSGLGSIWVDNIRLVHF